MSLTPRLVTSVPSVPSVTSVSPVLKSTIKSALKSALQAFKSADSPLRTVKCTVQYLNFNVFYKKQLFSDEAQLFLFEINFLELRLSLFLLQIFVI